MLAPSRIQHVPCVVVLVLALTLACATSKEQKQSAPLPTHQETRTETATAVVERVDLQTREVRLRGEDGKPFTIVAGDDVRNLPQVEVGDTVKVTYTESLALEVKRGDGSTPTVTGGATATRAPAGQKPGGTVSNTVTVSAEVVAIDRASSHVTLKGPEGNYRVVQVKDPKKLDNVQVGDMVFATYTESIGLAVEKVAPAPTK